MAEAFEIITVICGAARISVLGVGLVGGPGGGAPRTPDNFENLQKNF